MRSAQHGQLLLKSRLVCMLLCFEEESFAREMGPLAYTACAALFFGGATIFKKEHEVDFGTVTAGVATSGFQLCWSFDRNPVVRVGSFQLSGPFTAAVACTLTEACALQVSGVGLASSNAVRVLLSSALCGDAVTGVVSLSGRSSSRQ